ncbi:MAG: hypothetical protein ACJ76N_17460 [Thermoanaerobaculia bacterium]
MRRTVHRGIAALAIVTSLAAAGARPAAAMDLGLARQLSSLWSFVTGASPAQHRAASRSTKPGKATTPPPDSSDRGWGIDPNGNTVTIVPGTASTGG